MRSKISAGLHVMIRPGGGYFFNSLEEFESMGRDIRVARKLGRTAWFCASPMPMTTWTSRASRELVELARPLNVTCHRTFDMSADLFVRWKNFAPLEQIGF